MRRPSCQRRPGAHDPGLPGTEMGVRRWRRTKSIMSFPALHFPFAVKMVYTIVTISGEIDIASAPVLREQLVGLLPHASRSSSICPGSPSAMRAGLPCWSPSAAAPACWAASCAWLPPRPDGHRPPPHWPRLAVRDLRHRAGGPRAPAHPGRPRCGRAGATCRLASSARGRRAPRDRRRGLGCCGGPARLHAVS